MDEPVAWGVFEGNLHDMFFTQSEAQEMAELKGTHAEVRPLYAAPQRTWVGLTNEEMLECLKAVDIATAVNLLMSQYEMPPTFKVYAQAIEAKLKEKNT
jgi:hypothetical protein